MQNLWIKNELDLEERPPLVLGQGHGAAVAVWGAFVVATVAVARYGSLPPGWTAETVSAPSVTSAAARMRQPKDRRLPLKTLLVWIPAELQPHPNRRCENLQSENLQLPNHRKSGATQQNRVRGNVGKFLKGAIGELRISTTETAASGVVLLGRTARVGALQIRAETVCDYTHLIANIRNYAIV